MSRRHRCIAPLALGLCWVAACAPEASLEPAARNVILISIDTLRADHLGAYGHGLPTSPNLDALAAEGVLFEDAISTAPWTLPSHVSLLTGRFPHGHGVRTNMQGLADDVPTLAGVLAEQGYDTGAFVNAFFMERRFGLDRGFDRYAIFPEDQSRDGATRRVVEEARTWLAERGERRFFLLLHLFDVHSDYHSLPRYEQMFVTGPGRYSGNTIEIMMGMRGDIALEQADAERLSRLYDAGIRQLDDQLAGFLSWLRRRGSLDDTLLVVTSDHGEGFLDHGEMVHGNTHYQEMLRVPLLLVGGNLPADTRIASPVSLVDLMPTLLDLLGVEVPPGMDGRSLRPLWTGSAPDGDRAFLAETGPMEEDALRTLRRGRHKLIVDTRTGRRELYDLSADPLEKNDLSGALPELTREMATALEEMLRSPHPSRQLEPLTEEMKERLRSLGYLGP